MSFFMNRNYLLRKKVDELIKLYIYVFNSDTNKKTYIYHQLIFNYIIFLFSIFKLKNDIYL